MTDSKKYTPVNKCIYCGATNKELTDEHIIAYGLNSNSILPKSSCLECNKITSRIENNVMRGFAWQMRTALGFPTRRPKEVPKTFKLGIVKNGVESVIDVPVKDHPIFLPLPLFNLPAHFENHVFKKNIEIKEGIGLAGIQISWFADLEKIKQEHNADSFFVLGKFDHISFAHMLAKIAYCLAVAEFGLDAFEEIFVLPAIRGERKDIGQYVGSSERIFSEENAAHLSELKTYKNPDPNNPDGMIIAFIKLFADIPAPGYIVIVGRPK